MGQGDSAPAYVYSHRLLIIISKHFWSIFLYRRGRLGSNQQTSASHFARRAVVPDDKDRPYRWQGQYQWQWCWRWRLSRSRGSMPWPSSQALHALTPLFRERAPGPPSTKQAAALEAAAAGRLGRTLGITPASIPDCSSVGSRPMSVPPTPTSGPPTMSCLGPPPFQLAGLAKAAAVHAHHSHRRSPSAAHTDPLGGWRAEHGAENSIGGE